MRAAVAFVIFGIILLAIGIVAARENRSQTYEANMAEINQ